MNAAEHPHATGTYYFFNLGCPKNIADAGHAAARLEEAGWTEAETPAGAELLVVTTCSFIAEAEEESVDEILRVGAARESWQKLAVLGCLVSREGEKLRGLLPEVDLFLDVHEMDMLPGFVGSVRNVHAAERKGAVRRASGKLFTPSHLAYLKIAEGCSNHCSYCTIPSIRGELKSRELDEVILEAAELVSRGVRELVVVAQDSGAWGCERGGGQGLYDLLEAVKERAAPEWMRLMYVHPARADATRLVDLMNRGIILPYLDVPVQHVSDRVLDRMERGYRREDLERLFDTLRGGIGGLVLRTTVMVGFPGETEREFMELVDFLERYTIDHVGVFGYSAERGTRAVSLGPHVPRDEILRRKEEIIGVQMDVSQERLQRFEGRTEKILVDRLAEQDECVRHGAWGVGRFYGQAYEIDGVIFLDGNSSEPGRFIEAEVTEGDVYDLFASSR